MSLQPSSGRLFVVSAPSGVGKTTLINRIRLEWPDLCFSVSVTTRSPRPREVHGKDYFFITKEEFVRGVEAEAFIEWAQVHGNYYGTYNGQVRDWLAEGKDVLLDIDVQGARQVRCAAPHAWTIFVIPPSLEVLRQRLTKRGTETPEQLSLRLAAARVEMQEAAWYDFIILNADLQAAVIDFSAILRACRCHRTSQAHMLKRFLLGQARATDV